MSDESEVLEVMVGTHKTRFEPPDLFVTKYIGDYALDDIRGHVELYQRATGKFYLLLDVSELGSFTSEARKAIKEAPMASGVAIFGGSGKMQLIVSILGKVYSMVNMGKVEIKFFPSEADGRKWIDQLRQANKATP